MLPVVTLYCPMLPLPALTTKRLLLASIAIPIGPLSPWPLMKVVLMALPVVALYSPTVLLNKLRTKDLP